MSTRKFLKPILIAFFVLMMAPAAAFAQGTLEAKILVVDLQTVHENSLVGQDVTAQIKQYEIVLENRANELQTSLSAEGEQLVSQQAVLPPDMYQEQMTALQQRLQQASQEVEGKRQLLFRAIQAAQFEINRAVRPIIRSIMQSRGATIVLDKAFVYDTISTIDITNEVVQQLDQVLTSYPVQDPNV